LILWQRVVGSDAIDFLLDLGKCVFQNRLSAAIVLEIVSE